MYKIKNRFTSRDGRLEVDNREYGMTKEGLEVIGDVTLHLGGAVQIFVRMDGGPSSEARFFTRDGNYSFVKAEKPESGWAVFDLNKDAAYKPDVGEQGWWNVEVSGAPSEVAEGIGLPFSWHVSTFVVFEWEEEDSGGGDGGDGGDGEENLKIVAMELIFHYEDGSSLSVDLPVPYPRISGTGIGAVG